MKNELETLGRVRMRGLLLLVSVFLAGSLAGAAGERLLGGRREPGPPRGHRAGELPPILDHLDLTGAQRKQIEAILDRARPTSDSLMQVTMPAVRTLMEETHRAIRDVLTPEQRERFDRELKHGPGHEGFPGRHGGPGRPGGPGGPPPGPPREWGPPPDFPPAERDSLAKNR